MSDHSHSAHEVPVTARRQHRESRPYLGRRDRYVELRRSGTDKWGARDDLGVNDVTMRKYERYFQALERGETPLQLRPGGES